MALLSSDFAILYGIILFARTLHYNKGQTSIAHVLFGNLRCVLFQVMWYFGFACLVCFETKRILSTE